MRHLRVFGYCLLMALFASGCSRSSVDSSSDDDDIEVKLDAADQLDAEVVLASALLNRSLRLDYCLARSKNKSSRLSNRQTLRSLERKSGLSTSQPSCYRMLKIGDRTNLSIEQTYLSRRRSRSRSLTRTEFRPARNHTDDDNGILNDRSAKLGEPVQRILVIGGGTAGWMTAAYLRRRTNCQVALIESPNVPTVGVGEATIPAMIELLKALQLDEDQFMRQCHATYKLGIQFINWVQPEHRYWHPFGFCGGQIDDIDLFHFWLKRRHETSTDEEYACYSLQAALAQAGKIHRPVGGKPVVHNYAFHLDAVAFADYLRRTATQQGVRHVLADVQHVVTNETGWIDAVALADGRQVTADLYIDCTGFKGLLIEQALNDPYIDWSDTLLCDRAAVVRLPPDPQMPPYTQATAVSAGWICASRFVTESAVGTSIPVHIRVMRRPLASYWITRA